MVFHHVTIFKFEFYFEWVHWVPLNPNWAWAGKRFLRKEIASSVKGGGAAFGPISHLIFPDRSDTPSSCGSHRNNSGNRGGKCHTLWLTSNGRQLDLLAGQQRQSKQMDFLNFIKQKAKAERWRQNATTFGIISAVVWDLERWSRGSLEVEAFTYICGLPVVSQFTYYS